MMPRKIGRWLGVAVILLGGVGVLGVTQTSSAEFERALSAIPLATGERILNAINIGLSQPDFPATDVLHLIGRLASSSAPNPEKEAILLKLAVTLEEGLPVDGLVSKTFEGLARNVALPQIEQGLKQRVVLLAEVRDLLFSKGIFSVPAGSPPPAGPTTLPTPRLNQLLVHISGAIGDHLEGGGSPFEGHLLFQQVRERLIMLQGVTLPQEDVDLVLTRIEPSDLAQVALAAVI